MLGLGEVNDDVDAGLVVEVEDVVVTTTTTIPPVTSDTLPFTGFEAGAIALFGLLVAAGGLLLLVTTRPVGAHENRDRRATVKWANTR